jgi:cardiolipin synthase
MLQPRHIPNIITVFRMLLIPPVGWALLNGEYQLAFWLFFIAGFSDALDGFLARYFSWQSKFGATMDPIADKLLMIVTFYCMAWQNLIPWWLFVAVFLRDVVILGGAAAYQLVTKSLQMEPILLGKLNTFLQILLVLAVLTYWAYGVISAEAVRWLVLALLVSTIASGIAYIGIWSRKTREYRKQ